jgi:hypothetical protein
MGRIGRGTITMMTMRKVLNESVRPGQIDTSDFTPPVLLFFGVAVDS